MLCYLYLLSINQNLKTIQINMNDDNKTWKSKQEQERFDKIVSQVIIVLSIVPALLILHLFLSFLKWLVV